jgi:prepilin-type processing-associated H-X9-DG protein
MFVLLVIFVLASLILPAVQQGREAARVYACRNNLMQIGLALRNYESMHERFPPGTVNPGRPIKNVFRGYAALGERTRLDVNPGQTINGLPRAYHVGWVVRILPHLDQTALDRQFDFSVSVYDKKNSTALAGRLRVMNCPSSVTGGCGYAGCNHDIEAPIDIDNSGVFFLNRSIAQDDITDGLSHTIFVGERSDGDMFGWAAGTRDTLRNTGTPIGTASMTPGTGPGLVATKQEPANSLAVGGFSSFHGGGANFLFGDGSVRFLTGAIDIVVYQQLGHRADGKLLSDDF